MSYVIECRRSGDGFLDAAKALAKNEDGQVLIFDTREEADEKAHEWEASTRSAAVAYSVQEGESLTERE